MRGVIFGIEGGGWNKYIWGEGVGTQRVVWEGKEEKERRNDEEDEERGGSVGVDDDLDEG